MHHIPDTAPDTIKARARAALLLAVERVTETLEDRENALTLNELSQNVSALGRISGIGDEERDTKVEIVITRDSATPYAQALERVDAVTPVAALPAVTVGRDALERDSDDDPPVGGMPS